MVVRGWENAYSDTSRIRCLRSWCGDLSGCDTCPESVGESSVYRSDVCHSTSTRRLSSLSLLRPFVFPGLCSWVTTRRTSS